MNKQLLNNQSSDNNKRIIKNTFMLYTRQILVLLVSLFTIRVILDVLGVEDYGIYAVVGGAVTLLSFLSNTMASATQRFFSFAIGEGDQEKLNKILSVNFIIYLAIAITSFIFLETVGLWFIKNELLVPPERLDAVIFIFHCSILTFIISIFAAPFMAIIIAHEDMQYYAYISIFEVVLKLGVVFLLMYINWDKLQLYGLLLLIVAILTVSMYIYVCLNKYKEVQFRKFYWDKKLCKEIINFTSWTLFGQITTVARDQGITILLNQVFSPMTVAARAISSNIASKINMFSANFNIGLYPPIIKAYATDDKVGMYKLINNGSKITFFLMWIFALPLFLEMENILNLWLKNPPPETLIFSRLALVESLIVSVSLPLGTAARAPGKMKVYELTLGLLQFLLFGLAYVFLKIGYPAYTVYYIAICINIVMFFARLLIVGKLTGLRTGVYIHRVIIPLLIIVILSSIITLIFKWILPNSLFYSFILMVLSILISSISMYFIGLNKEWRLKVRLIILKKLKV